MKITKPKRHFADDNLKIKDWASIEPYYSDLLNREIKTQEDFQQWLNDLWQKKNKSIKQASH